MPQTNFPTSLQTSQPQLRQMRQQQNGWKLLQEAGIFLTPRPKETKQLNFHLCCPSLVLPHNRLRALSHKAGSGTESWGLLKV